MTTLSIRIIPHHNSEAATIVINDNAYVIHPENVKSLEDIRVLLSNEPEYVYTAVISMLEEMTK